MTPLRKVLTQNVLPDGSILSLECGHQVWLAGCVHTKFSHRCGQSPCYRPEKYMGNDG